MTLEPYKFVVQAIVQRRDESGAVIGEVTTEPAVLFGCDALADWAASFPANLQLAEQREAAS